MTGPSSVDPGSGRSGVKRRNGVIALFAVAFGVAVPVSAQPYSEAIVHSFPPPLGGNVRTSLIQASDGNLYGTVPDGGSKGWGAVFKISSLDTSPTPSVIYSFLGGNDGGDPQASLIQASDGNLYGTTRNGGSSGMGTVFVIRDLSGTPTESVIHSLAGGSDGSKPVASLIQASDGNLYGTTYGGGSSGAGTVFRISDLSTVPTESVIYSFTGNTDGGYPSAALIQASDGNLYGTTIDAVFKISNPTTSPATSVIYNSFGRESPQAASLIQASDGNLYGTTYSITFLDFGAFFYDKGTVFKISDLATLPIVTIIHSFTAPTDGRVPFASLIQASDGNLYGTTGLGGSSDEGTVFKISNLTTSPTFNVTHSFTGGSDGSNPHASVIQASDGNLYGTTYAGGSSSFGTVFKISDLMTSGTESVICAFMAGGDGVAPYGPLIQTSDGNLYGTTPLGGSNNCPGESPIGCGTIFKISNLSTSPTESVIYSFMGGRDGSGPLASLIQASDGNLYGTTPSGGSDFGTVFKVSDLATSPTETVIHRFAWESDGSLPSASMIQATDGSLYGTTTFGGPKDAGVVFRISNLSTSPTFSVIYAFTGGDDGSNPMGPLIQASDGNLYGTTGFGGNTFNDVGCQQGCGTVFQISHLASSPTFSVIHFFTGGSDGSNSFASLIQASDGNLYGTTWSGGSNNSGTVFKISNLSTTPVEGVIYSFAGENDGALPVASLIQAFDGNLYGTTYYGGVDGFGTVFKIGNLATSPTEGVVYNFTGGNDGGYPQASLIQASDGKLYGTTFNDGTAGWGAVFRIDLQGGRSVGRPPVRLNPVPPVRPTPIRARGVDRSNPR